MSTRLALIAGAVVALVIAGASPAAAMPQSKAAATRRPTAADVAQVRQAIAEYRTMWNTELDAESRGIARQYGAPTPEALEKMLRDWEAGLGSRPNVPAGKPAGAVRKTPSPAPAAPAAPKPAPARPDPPRPDPPRMPQRLGPPRPAPARTAPAPAPSRPAPVRPEEEPPDFVDGAPKEALDTLRADAKVNLDDIRDKHAEDANCSPEARSSKQALQGKLDAYRKALTDMESARAQVENGKGAGAALEKATTLASANDAVKSTMDAAMDLFGAANGVFLGGNKSGEALGAVYSAAQGVISASRAATPDQAAEAGIVLNLTKAAATKLPDYAPLNLALAAGDVGTKLIETSKLRDDKTIEPTARDLQTAGNGTQILGTGIGALGELPYTTVAARTSAGALIHTTDYKVVTVNPVKAMGTAVSAVGTVVSTSINYDRELGKAFDTIAAGQDEHREYDALSESTMRQIGAKRVEFMEKIAALEAEIGRSGCIK